MRVGAPDWWEEERESGRLDAARIASRRHPPVRVTRLLPENPRAAAVEAFERDADYGVGPQGARRPGGPR